MFDDDRFYPCRAFLPTGTPNAKALIEDGAPLLNGHPRAAFDFKYNPKTGEAHGLPKEYTSVEEANIHYGIYWIPNECRVDVEFTSSDLVFVEWDDLSFEDQFKKLRMLEDVFGKAAAVIQTKKSLHCYWRLKESINSPGIWKETQKRLIKFVGSDCSIYSPAQCMRAPGFNHLSYDDDGNTVRIPVRLVEESESVLDFKVLDNHLPIGDSDVAVNASEMIGNRLCDFAHLLSHYNPEGRRGYATCQCPNAHNHPGSDKAKDHSTNSLHILTEKGHEKFGAFICHAGCNPKTVYAEARAVALSKGYKFAEVSRDSGSHHVIRAVMRIYQESADQIERSQRLDALREETGLSASDWSKITKFIGAFIANRSLEEVAEYVDSSIITAADPYVLFPRELANHFAASSVDFDVRPENFYPMFLSICSMLVGNNVKIEVRDTWSEPLIINGLLVGPSGSAKTHINAVSLDPLVKLDEANAAHVQELIEDYNSLDSDDQADAELPENRLYYLTGATLSGANSITESQPGKGFVFIKDEMGVLLSSGKNSDPECVALAEEILTLFNGKPNRTATRGRGVTEVETKVIPFAGACQPEYILNGEDSKGLLARFLVSMIENYGNVSFIEDKIACQKDGPTGEIVEIIYERLEQMGKGTLTLSGDARKESFDFINELRQERADASRFSMLATYCTSLPKLESYFYRIMGVLHLVHESFKGIDYSNEISLALVKKAITLTRYFKAQALITRLMQQPDTAAYISACYSGTAGVPLSVVCKHHTGEPALDLLDRLRYLSYLGLGEVTNTRDERVVVYRSTSEVDPMGSHIEDKAHLMVRFEATQEKGCSFTRIREIFSETGLWDIISLELFIRQISVDHEIVAGIARPKYDYYSDRRDPNQSYEMLLSRQDGDARDYSEGDNDFEEDEDGDCVSGLVSCDGNNHCGGDDLSATIGSPSIEGKQTMINAYMTGFNALGESQPKNPWSVTTDKWYEWEMGYKDARDGLEPDEFYGEQEGEQDNDTDEPSDDDNDGGSPTDDDDSPSDGDDDGGAFDEPSDDVEEVEESEIEDDDALPDDWDWGEDPDKDSDSEEDEDDEEEEECTWGSDPEEWDWGPDPDDMIDDLDEDPVSNDPEMYYDAFPFEFTGPKWEHDRFPQTPEEIERFVHPLEAYLRPSFKDGSGTLTLDCDLRNIDFNDPTLMLNNYAHDWKPSWELGVYGETVFTSSVDIETCRLPGETDPKAALSPDTAFISAIGITYRHGDELIHQQFSIPDGTFDLGIEAIIEAEVKVLADYLNFQQSLWSWDSEAINVIAGHNFYNFDAPFIRSRYRRSRDKIQPLLTKYAAINADKMQQGSHEVNFTSASVNGSPPKYTPFYWGGWQIVDTYLLAGAHDKINACLSGYSLKVVPYELGLIKESRHDLDHKEIEKCVMGVEGYSMEMLLDYLKDDTIATDLLLDYWMPVLYFQLNIFPLSLQQLAVASPPKKFTSLLETYYGDLGWKLDYVKADEPIGIEGGLGYIFPGLYENTCEVDFASLYPSLMLQYGLGLGWKDPHNVFLSVVNYARKKLFSLKTDIKNATSDDEKTALKAQRNSCKVIANGAYGATCTGGVPFNYFPTAALITGMGRQLTFKVGEAIKAEGNQLIFAATDAVLFTGPNRGEVDITVVDRINESLPSMLNLAIEFTGRITYAPREKNYMVFSKDGKCETSKGLYNKRNFSELEKTLAGDFIAAGITGGVAAQQALKDQVYYELFAGVYPASRLSLTKKIPVSDVKLTGMGIGLHGDKVTIFTGVEVVTKEPTKKSLTEYWRTHHKSGDKKMTQKQFFDSGTAARLVETGVVPRITKEIEVPVRYNPDGPNPYWGKYYLEKATAIIDEVTEVAEGRLPSNYVEKTAKYRL